MDKETLVCVDLDGTPHPMGRLWAPVPKNRKAQPYEFDEGWLKHPARFSLEPALQIGPAPSGQRRNEGQEPVYKGYNATRDHIR